MNNSELTIRAIQEGYLLELGDGFYVFTPRMVRLINKLRDLLIIDVAKELDFEEWIFPRIVPEDHIKSTGWLKHHPNQAFLVHSLPNSIPLRGRFLLDPIQCVSLYSVLANKQIEELCSNGRLPLKVFETSGGWSYRNERTLDGLFRARAFLRVEFIYFASRKQVIDIRNTILNKAITLLNTRFELNLIKAKGDSCFLESPPTKSEEKYSVIGEKVGPQTPSIDIVYKREGTEEYIELASGTFVNDHISKQFNIQSSELSELCSGCFGFGLNRLALMMLECKDFKITEENDAI